MVHTLKAKSCSLGRGEIKDRASLSYSEGLYRSTDMPLLPLIDSVMGVDRNVRVNKEVGHLELIYNW